MNWIFATILALVVIVPVGIFIVKWRRSPLSLRQTIFWSLNYLITRLVWGTRVEGQLPIEPGKGAVIVANHRSSIDPSFIQICLRRVVYWMVAREYCEAPAIGWLLREFQVIPVGRGGIDTAATKLAIRLARQGGLIGMFPEGRINTAPDKQLLLPGRPGAALVALKARVPIIPVFIDGAPYNGTSLGPLFMRAMVRVKIGQPIDISAYFGREKEEGVTQEITLRAMREMAKLAGHPEFEPQLAGRRWKSEDDLSGAGGNGNFAANESLAANSNGQPKSATSSNRTTI